MSFRTLNIKKFDAKPPLLTDNSKFCKKQVLFIQLRQCKTYTSYNLPKCAHKRTASEVTFSKAVWEHIKKYIFLNTNHVFYVFQSNTIS